MPSPEKSRKDDRAPCRRRRESPIASTSGAARPPASPSARRAAPWAACLATAANPVSRWTGRVADARQPSRQFCRAPQARAPFGRTGSPRARQARTRRVRHSLDGALQVASRARRSRGVRGSAIAAAGASGGPAIAARRRRTAGPSKRSRPETRPRRRARRRRAARAVRTIPPAPSTMRAAVDGDRRRKRAAQLEQDERDLPFAAIARRSACS